jgi:hypothetical protein
LAISYRRIRRIQFMGLFNDAYDAADIMMTEHEKGKKAAQKKKAEIQFKKQQ